MSVCGSAGVEWYSYRSEGRGQQKYSERGSDESGAGVVAVLVLDVELVGKTEAKAGRFGSAQPWSKRIVTQEQGCWPPVSLRKTACMWPSGALADWRNNSFPPDMNLSCSTGTVFEISLLTTSKLAT